MKKEPLVHEGFMTFHSGGRPLQSCIIVCDVLSGFTLVVRSHFKSSLRQMIMQARMQNASYIEAYLS